MPKRQVPVDETENPDSTPPFCPDGWLARVNLRRPHRGWRTAVWPGGDFVYSMMRFLPPVRRWILPPSSAGRLIVCATRKAQRWSSAPSADSAPPEMLLDWKRRSSPRRAAG